MGILSGLIDWITPDRPQVVGITDEALQFMIQTGRDTHPNEMLGVLRGKPLDEIEPRLERVPETDSENPYVITGFDIPPRLQQTPISASFNPHMLPVSNSRIGVVHSHPSGVLRPSNTDVNEGFAVGHIHIIVGAPYEDCSWNAFHSDGSHISLSVLPTRSQSHRDGEFSDEF